VALAGRALGKAAGRAVRNVAPSVAAELGRILQQRAASATRAAPGQTSPASPASGAFGPRNRIAAAAIYYSWLAGLFACVVAILNVDLLIARVVTVTPLRLALGSILLIEGILLATDWGRARRRLVDELLVRSRLVRSRRRGHAVWRPRVYGAVLTLVGVVWFAIGLTELLRGIVALT
jgi:hypothetical protein